MMVWKMYLLSNMAILGIYVRFQGGNQGNCWRQFFPANYMYLTQIDHEFFESPLFNLTFSYLFFS